MKTQMMVKAAGAMMLMGALMTAGQAEAKKKTDNVRPVVYVETSRSLSTEAVRTPGGGGGGMRLPEEGGAGLFFGIEARMLWEVVRLSL